MPNFMKSQNAFTARIVFLVLFLFPVLAKAQTSPVPPEFQDLYNTLNTDLANFNTTLDAQSAIPHNLLAIGNLKYANANAGPSLVGANSLAGVQLQLQELKSIGVQAVMVEVGFPMLYQPFLTSQGQAYSQYVSFYQQVAAAVRAAGLRLIVENDTLLVNDVQAGWNAAPFYATLDWDAYQQARAQTAVTVVQTMQPDYLVAVEEPNTEANNSGQTQANTPSGSAALLNQILTAVRQSGVPALQVGAGTGTAQANFIQFIQGYTAMPVDFIDMHVYPINRSYLSNAQQIVATAASAGKPVSMSECWLWKIRDNELGVMTPSQVRARNPFDFWEPLDSYFIQTMQNLGRRSQMLFLNPFNSESFAAYLPYNTSTSGLSPSQILNQQTTLATQNIAAAIYTGTALSYYSSLITTPDQAPPFVPGGLSGASGNPTQAFLSWNPSADNVGVAGYHVLRNGVVTGTTANVYYVDTGLAQSATYSYTVEAFDLAGNVSAPSPWVSVTTADATAPSVPAKISAAPVSIAKINVSWSASADNVAVGSYIVFSLFSGSAVSNRTVPGTTLSFSNSPLNAATNYCYGVEAADNSGNVSPMSATVCVSTPALPPAPTSVSATATSTSRISVAWSAPAASGLPIQKVTVSCAAAPLRA